MGYWMMARYDLGWFTEVQKELMDPFQSTVVHLLGMVLFCHTSFPPLLLWTGPHVSHPCHFLGPPAPLPRAENRAGRGSG